MARDRELPALTRLWSAAAGNAALPNTHSPGHSRSRAVLKTRLEDGCLLVAENRRGIVAFAGIDLDRGSLGEMFFENHRAAEILFKPLLARAEQTAIRFGMLRLQTTASARSERWFIRQGYAPAAARDPGSGPDRGAVVLTRSLARRQTRFGRKVHALGSALGIPPDYGRSHRLALQDEARELAGIGTDVFGREQFVAPECANAWFGLRQAASDSGVEIQPVSAFRSVDYQGEIIRKKLARGLSITEVLQVSAAPGYSEHHTGQALDLTTPGFRPLEEEFEHSPAFAWLENHAGHFGFRLSFGRSNRHGLAYEPWHWCFRP